MTIDISKMKWFAKIMLPFFLMFLWESIVLSASKGGILQIEALKLYQTSKSHAAMDIRFINTTTDDIKGWGIIIEIYDQNNKYLGSSIGAVYHIRSGESKVKEVIFLDIQISQIAYWTATLDSIVGYSGLREDQKYTMKIKTNN